MKKPDKKFILCFKTNIKNINKDMDKLKKEYPEYDLWEGKVFSCDYEKNPLCQIVAISTKLRDKYYSKYF